jgi:hypothetical protein
MGARSVVVVMPFGGRDSTERRRAILNFKRVEYLVRNKCTVTSVDPAGKQNRVVYAVEVAKTAMDEIPEKALKQIEAADIVIALVVEPNPNVIYEIAYRRALAGTVVLVVDNTDNLPLYLKSVGYQSWKQGEVMNRISQIANDSFREISDFSVGIPDDLKRAVDIYDGELQKGLEEALQEIESGIKPPPPKLPVQHLCGVVSDDSITNFYPSSIVEVSFSAHGEFEDPDCPAIVRDFDDGFSRLYGYADKKQALADGPLNLTKLLGRIQEFLDASFWEEFMKEQVKLSAAIKAYRFARAKVPLRINDLHPHNDYCGKSYLPCMIAQATDGDKTGPHKVYLLVVYIELSTASHARPAYKVIGEECHA